MFLYYLGKLKVQNVRRYSADMEENANFVVFNFVIDPQILIFLVFNIANFSLHWLQIKFSMLLFFCLITFAINLWHRKFITADVTAVFVNKLIWYSATRTRFWEKQINTLRIHSYTCRGIKISASMHLRCTLFAFSSISGIIAKYLQKIWIFDFSRTVV